MVWDVLSRVAEKVWDVLSRVTKTDEMFCPEWQNFVECFARGVKKGMNVLSQDVLSYIQCFYLKITF